MYKLHNFSAGMTQTSPLSLFNNGQSGAYFLADPQRLYQGFNGTTAVTATSDPVGFAQNLLSRVIAKAADLPGAAGDYISTPDSAAASITGDLEIIVKVALDDWTPTAAQVLVSKYLGTGNQRSYLLYIQNTGEIVLTQSRLGTNASADNFISTVATGITNGAVKWVKATLDVDNGASGRTAKFYLSDDGVTYTQLGTDVTVATAANTFDSNAEVMIGSYLEGASLNLNGTVYLAQIYNGIGGTLALDFNPEDYLGGSSLVSSSTGETWAINGDVVVAQPDMAADLPGASGDYLSTPDSVAASITGDLEIQALVSMEDWTPSAIQIIVSKYLNTGNQRSYYLAVNTNGTLILNQSTDGTSGSASNFFSTVATGVTNGQSKWIKATLDVNNGASGRTANFYLSDDGLTWTQLGTSVTVATAANTFNSTASVIVGSYLAGTTQMLQGKVYLANIYNGIGGTLAVSFSPNSYTGGATFVSTTGETWTLNGNAVIAVPGGHALQSSSTLRPLYGTRFINMDGVDDALVANLDNLGIAATIAYSTSSEVVVLVGQTISGQTTLPDVDWYSVIYRDEAFSAQEESNVTRYLANLAGLSSGAQSSYTPTQFTDTGTTVDMGDYYLTSGYASLDFTTSATAITVNAYNNLHDTFPTFASVGIYVNGVYNQSILQGAEGDVSRSVILPAGSKTVSIVNGPQSRPSPSGSILGTFIKSVSSSLPMTQTNLAPSNRILVYGDSIVAGDAASPVQQSSWFQIVRAAAYPDSVAQEAWGYRALYRDCQTSGQRAAFVSIIAAYSPETLWIAIGTNDYALNLWTAADFGTAYAALLDDLHTALPSMAIYCQSPTVRVTETANGLGSTLGNYRTQISTAAAARPTYCTYIDGSTIITVGELSDNVHPNTAGHATYGAFVISTLGL